MYILLKFAWFAFAVSPYLNVPEVLVRLLRKIQHGVVESGSGAGWQSPVKHVLRRIPFHRITRP